MPRLPFGKSCCAPCSHEESLPRVAVATGSPETPQHRRVRALSVAREATAPDRPRAATRNLFKLVSRGHVSQLLAGFVYVASRPTGPASRNNVTESARPVAAVQTGRLTPPPPSPSCLMIK